MIKIYQAFLDEFVEGGSCLEDFEHGEFDELFLGDVWAGSDQVEDE